MGLMNHNALSPFVVTRVPVYVYLSVRLGFNLIASMPAKPVCTSECESVCVCVSVRGISL